jgi:hypothetical protein
MSKRRKCRETEMVQRALPSLYCGGYESWVPSRGPRGCPVAAGIGSALTRGEIKGPGAQKSSALQKGSRNPLNPLVIPLA